MFYNVSMKLSQLDLKKFWNIHKKIYKGFSANLKEYDEFTNVLQLAVA